jgi:hypothetical protein
MQSVTAREVLAVYDAVRTSFVEKFVSLGLIFTNTHFVTHRPHYDTGVILVSFKETLDPVKKSVCPQVAVSYKIPIS